MQLFYQGKDITDQVEITRCVHRETSGGRCDCLEIELENVNSWYSWEPKKDDTIIAAVNGYQTGKLYLNTIIPEERQFRILATSAPSTSKRRKTMAYEKQSLQAILSACAGECGMTGALYGISGGITYPYMVRRMESAAAFINRLMEWEGAAFKTAGGRFAGIGIEHIQGTSPGQKIDISAYQSDIQHIRREDMKWSSVTIKTPYAEGTASDSNAGDAVPMIFTELPALDAATAKRWAKGILLSNNRKAEKLIFSTEFNAGFAAMVRIDIGGQSATEGEWIIDEVEHDMITLKSRVTMLRCVSSIG